MTVKRGTQCTGSTLQDEEDPSVLSNDDRYFFSEGTHQRAYDWMGAHPITLDGVQGTLFVFWAPNASRVSVQGDFNDWNGQCHVMCKHSASGLWELFIPHVHPGALYKYEIYAADGRLLPAKSDPYAFALPQPSDTASMVCDTKHYRWGDKKWMDTRRQKNRRNAPVSIYEVHLGSWMRNVEAGNRYLSYSELADQLIPYVTELGFTHIQLMPVSEYPFDGSWGYQPIGLFAPSSRFGSPEDFKFFVDSCHQAGLGLILDWVPGHFPTDEHGLGQLDGTALYEHEDPRRGFHPDWNTFIYNYERREVISYLLSNAHYWFEEYHADGLRVDAVASMLYLDYSRQEGEWLPNEQGGRENLGAIKLLQLINERVYAEHPDVMMIAEESTDWPGVSHPTYTGGLGFGFKWNMGWMNDSLRYMSRDPVHRSHHHNEMTFSLTYAFSENFILPLSHDEVVHGKGSLLSRMPGDDRQQFANLRAFLGFMWTHPGKKLLFQGGEFAQRAEWNHDKGLDWQLLDAPMHSGVQQLVKDLNHLYRAAPALYELDCEAEGFEWLVVDDSGNSVFAYLRLGREARSLIIVVSNFTPAVHRHFRLGVPLSGLYRERLNTDSNLYGGGNVGNAGAIKSEKIGEHGRPYSICLQIPPLATLIFELTYEVETG